MTARDPLIVTGDDELGEELSRIAAAAGCEPRRAAPEELEQGWRTARPVLLDPCAAAECAAAGLPRGTETVLVSRDPEPDFWRAAFRCGARHAVALPADEQWLVELLAGLDEQPVSGAGSVLAVLGGCGGAGASVFAALTAVLAAKQGRRCMLLDCDPLGGGLDFALGEERAVGVRWSDLSIGTGRVTADALREALPTRRFGSGALSLLCPGRTGQGITKRSVEAVVEAGARAGETVVCDLPRTLDEPSAEVLRRADLTAVVIPAEVRACAAAGKLLTSLRERTESVRAVVRGPAPGGLEVSDVRRSVDVEIVAAMRADPRMAGLVDRFGLYALGSGMRGPSVRAARKVLGALGETRWETGDPDSR
ncbi:septum site-determining protein Ssd [Actinopolyspora sp. BKK1]|uniref:septum site-determining protein Ssd n=1 Tax=Actinopolyspora TaxID=1849 RepID=UPI00325AAF40